MYSICIICICIICVVYDYIILRLLLFLCQAGCARELLACTEAPRRPRETWRGNIYIYIYIYMLSISIMLSIRYNMLSIRYNMCLVYVATKSFCESIVG